MSAKQIWNSFSNIAFIPVNTGSICNDNNSDYSFILLREQK